MIVYTAEDFAQANLATRGEFGVARRADPRLTHQWHGYGGRQGRFSDEEMAADGWEPVVETAAHDRVVTLLDTKKTHERAIAGLRHDLALAREELVDLRVENDRLERALRDPLLMEALEVAWEAAERADECRKGDVLIIRDDEDNYLVRRMDSQSRLAGTARILSRAPKREPWADLADVLADMGHLSPTGHAKALYERGVRVTGGEASE